MNHHAYFVAGDVIQGTKNALGFVRNTLKLDVEGNPDVIHLTYGLFPVEEARLFQDAVYRHPVCGDRKVVIITTSRIFHEAQNALLKVFEEPPEGTYLILILPSAGQLLPTLRSRVLPLPGMNVQEISEIAELFLNANVSSRSKMIDNLLDKAKSDNDALKQIARADALSLMEGIQIAAYKQYREEGKKEYQALLQDVEAFIPILHERSAPLKQIFEHLMLILPRGLKA